MNHEVIDTKSPNGGLIKQNLNPSLAALWLALALFAAALCVNPSTANDLFWQLRAGHEIAVGHAIPHADHFSWSRYGHPWVAHEWGSFVILWLAYAASGGYAGVWLVQTALVILTVSILYFVLHSETGSPITAFILCAWATIVSSAYFEPRPQLFTYLFLTILLMVLQAVRRNSKRGRVLWLLVPMCIVWANLHAGVIVGVGILALFAIGEAVDVSFSLRTADTTQDALSGVDTANGAIAFGADYRLAATLAAVAVACAALLLSIPTDGMFTIILFQRFQIRRR